MESALVRSPRCHNCRVASARNNTNSASAGCESNSHGLATASVTTTTGSPKISTTPSASMRW